MSGSDGALPTLPATYYRLRPGVRHPAFRSGELYKFLQRDTVEGYIFVQLGDRPRCVLERDFEPIEQESGLEPAQDLGIFFSQIRRPTPWPLILASELSTKNEGAPGRDAPSHADTGSKKVQSSICR